MSVCTYEFNFMTMKLWVTVTAETKLTRRNNMPTLGGL